MELLAECPFLLAQISSNPTGTSLEPCAETGTFEVPGSMSVPPPVGTYFYKKDQVVIFKFQFSLGYSRARGSRITSPGACLPPPARLGRWVEAAGRASCGTGGPANWPAARSACSTGAGCASGPCFGR